MKAIFVTGASSGIGLSITENLSQMGYIVYATYRKDSDHEYLSKIKNVKPVKLDVRSLDDMKKALEYIRSEQTGLYGLVNNAGVGGLGLFNTWTEEEFRDIFEINVIGPFNLTNTLLPLLLESKGRVVNIGSQGGMITKKYFGPYTMTKHALEAYTDALHEELVPHGIEVSIVQPGGITSKIGENSLQEIITRFKRAEEPFKQETDTVLESFTNPPHNDKNDAESEINRKISPPEIVSTAVVDALFNESPRRRYLVGTKWEGDRVINRLLLKLIEENDNPIHNYSRDKLIALLDHQIEQWTISNN